VLDVAFISQPEYFRFMYENELDGIANVREFSYKFNMTKMDFSELLEYDPDLVIVFRGEFFPEEVLNELTGIKVNLSSEPFPRQIEEKYEFSNDSLCRFNLFSNIKKRSFDYIFHYEAASLEFLSKVGFKLSGEFVFPVSRSIYKKKKMPTLWDLFFVGRSTLHREKFFSKLKHNYNFLHICHGIWGVGLVDYLNQSKILLNVHAEDEISWEPRMQMLLATGKLVISEKITPNRFLAPGKDYIEVSTPNQMFEAVQYYLNREEEREQIVYNANKKIEKYFDSKKIFNQFFRDIVSGEYPRFCYKKQNLLSSGINLNLKFSLLSLKVFSMLTKQKKKIKSRLKI